MHETPNTHANESSAITLSDMKKLLGDVIQEYKLDKLERTLDKMNQSIGGMEKTISELSDSIEYSNKTSTDALERAKNAEKRVEELQEEVCTLKIALKKQEKNLKS